MPLIISFDEQQVVIDPMWLDLLYKVGEALLVQEGALGSEVSVLLVDDETISMLNEDWRGISAPTDVLSFALRDDAISTLPSIPGLPELLGDVVISIPRAKEQATQYGHTILRELAFLLSHGILHLLGYDHQTQQQEATMRAKQEKVLSFLGLEV